MTKIADKYLSVDPWKIVEDGFDPARGRVTESIFALGNEHMGSRASFDEGFGGDSMVGNYLNGVFEEAPIQHPNNYKGISTRTRFMVNTLNWFAAEIRCGDETLDLSVSRFSNFSRELDLKSGELVRCFVWETGGKKILFTFRRFLSMDQPELACRRIEMTALTDDAVLSLTMRLDFSAIHHAIGKSPWTICQRGQQAILGRTQNTKQFVFSTFRLDLPDEVQTIAVKNESSVGTAIHLQLKKDQPVVIDQQIVNRAVKQFDGDLPDLWNDCVAQTESVFKHGYDVALSASRDYWNHVWATQDIEILGDDEQQQGIRYCIFQLHQTYHGVDAGNNVGAKGLTGEAYSGHTFWDTETYCLPFYLFNNPQAARNLLEYRYNTLPQAKEWAKEQDCIGAFYPMSTIDGTESCGIWWHGNLEIHISAAVAYGIWHYMKVCDDADFLFSKGVEMLIEISRFYASRGNFSPDGEYGFFGVMGPDEFHTFVNQNAYTNVMAKKTFGSSEEAINRMALEAPQAYKRMAERISLKDLEREQWKEMDAAMALPVDERSGVIEQHAGYFDLPHLDIHSIPVEEFPLYHSWSLPRIYRYDMIKQPDVLLLQLFFSADYSLQSKRVNYEYYEPRCIHESSLSPSVHSILAAEIGNQEDAVKFSRFATRLDLDNYNRNTSEGLHTTSIAAAWMNIVYGFGGMRTDGDQLAFQPTIPAHWTAYSFSVTYRESTIKVEVNQSQSMFRVVHGDDITLMINDENVHICSEARTFAHKGDLVEH